MVNVSPDQADTYKCFAVNEHGRAVVTVVLNVIEGKQISVTGTVLMATRLLDAIRITMTFSAFSRLQQEQSQTSCRTCRKLFYCA